MNNLFIACDMHRMQYKLIKVNSSSITCISTEWSFHSNFVLFRSCYAVLIFSHLDNRLQCLLFEYCKTLRFLNGDDTSGQIEYFFQLYSHTKYLPQLKLLTILDMKIDYVSRSIYLSFIRNLKIIYYYFMHEYELVRSKTIQ